MACVSRSMISASSCAFPSQRTVNKWPKARSNSNNKLFSLSPSSNSEETDCNVEECAPDKGVGKVSVEWLAGEKTKVVGTFPPKKKGWTGYVEKDTAGQTNIYSVEPVVYVSESAISSGTAGQSAKGAENTAAIAAGLALISIAAAASILLQVGKNPPEVQTSEYSGPPLSYYISKFKPVEIVEEAVIPTEAQTQSSEIVQSERISPDVAEVQVELNNQVQSQSSELSNAS